MKVKVPKGAGGPAQIARSLETEDYAEALRRAPLVVAEIRSEIEAKRRNADGTRKDQKGPVTPEDKALAAWWVERRVPHPSKPGRFLIPPTLEFQWDADVAKLLGDPVAPDTDDPPETEKFDPAAEARTLDFIGLVTGERVPVEADLDRYIAQEGIKASYESRTRSAVRRLVAWLSETKRPNDRRAIAGPIADKFADSLSTGRTLTTVNSLVSALSAYWGWMRKRQLVPTNPWQGQSRTIKKDAPESLHAEKRAFSDDEIVTLLNGEAGKTLGDLMRIAALSGMRLSEIGNLRVRDVRDDHFHVEKGKTEAARRSVPIHPTLSELVDARIKGKAQDEYLIEELLTPPSRPARRGGKAGERFTKYRRALGVDSQKPGRRQSDIEFHSFRRWFVTKAEQAGQQEAIIAAVVGHSRVGITLSYSDGPSAQQARRVVESVQLPSDVVNPKGV